MVGEIDNVAVHAPRVKCGCRESTLCSLEHVREVARDGRLRVSQHVMDRLDASIARGRLVQDTELREFIDHLVGQGRLLTR